MRSKRRLCNAKLVYFKLSQAAHSSSTKSRKPLGFPVQTNLLVCLSPFNLKPHLLDSATTMKKQIKTLALVCLCLTALTTSTNGQIAPQVFETKTILPQSLIQATDFRVAPTTTVKDYEFQFSIETESGTFPVSGIPLLERRISELGAIERAIALSDKTVALNTAWETLKKTPEGARHLLVDPRGTLAAAPKGLKRWASNIVNPVDRRVGTAARRRLAANLGVDPQTRNPVLKKLLTELSAREILGGASTKLALGAILPGLGSLSTAEDFREKIATRNPHELLQEINVELNQLGVYAPVREEFIASSRWTLVEKLTFVSFYRQLAGVQHADVIIHMANRDQTETDILRRLIGLRLLVELHSKSPIKTISDSGLPIAWLNNGQIVGVVAVDFLTNSVDVQNVAAGFRKSNPDTLITLLSTGWLSNEAKQTLDSQKIEFKRVSFSDGNKNQAKLSTGLQAFQTESRGSLTR